MGFLTNLYRSMENPSQPLKPDWGGKDTLSGVRVTARVALGYPPLWRGVNLICNGVGKLGLITYRRMDDGRERDRTHPAYRLLTKKPNKRMTAGVFKKTLQFHALLWGNGYAAIFRNERNGQPEELVVLDPMQTVPYDNDGELWYLTRFKFQGQEITRRMPAENVLHIRGLSFDGLTGYSVLELLGDPIGGAIAANRHAARFFKKGMMIDGLLQLDGQMNRDAQLQAIDDFRAITAGIDNQHKVAVLEGGAKFVPMSFNAQRGQMLETRRFNIIEISNILGLPPHKLGDSSRTSYNSLEMEQQSYIDDGLDPHLCAWEEEAEDKLLTEREKDADSHYMEFNRNQMISTDFSTRMTGYKIARDGGWFSVNDIRRKENEPSIGPEGDTYTVPANMVNAQEFAGVRAASREALLQAAGRMADIERRQCTDKAGKSANFIEWMEGFYRDQSAKLEGALLPTLRIWGAVTERGVNVAQVRAIVAEHLEQSRQMLLTVSGEARADQLAEAVSGCDRLWDAGRIERLVDQLMGESNADPND